MGSPRFAPFLDYWSGAFTGYFDAFTVGINGHNTIYDFEPNIANAGEDRTILYGYGSTCTTLQATATGGVSPYSYTWSAGDKTWTGAEMVVCPATTTTYSITVTDAQGCSGTNEVTVFVNDVRCGKKENKVLVCHNGKELCIASAAVASHLNHSDKVGPCSSNPIAQKYSQNAESDYISKEIAQTDQFKLSNYPNPFGTATSIQYELPYDCAVSLKVYDATGRVVSNFVSENKKAGRYSVDFRKQGLNPGVYYYRLTATSRIKSFTQTKRMVLPQ